jgi:gamma-glutamylcysteine synthetase
MIGYFYVKTFEMHGLDLPGLLKVCVHKNDRFKNIFKQCLILASVGFLLIGIGGRQKWKENLENIKSPKKRSSII